MNISVVKIITFQSYGKRELWSSLKILNIELLY